MLLKRVESIYIHKLRLPLAAVDSHFKSEKQRERGVDAADEKFKTWGFNPIGGVPLNSHMKTKASCCCSRSSSCSYISILLTQCYKIWINKKLGELFELSDFDLSPAVLYTDYRDLEKIEKIIALFFIFSELYVLYY